MTTVRFSKDAEVTTFVLRKLSVEGLQQSPNVWCCSNSTINVVGAIREANTDRLVDVQHVRIAVEAVGIDRWGRGSVIELAWAILLEEAYHTTAARTAVEPGGKWSRCRVCSSFEEPEPHVHVRPNGKVPAVLIHTGGGLTNAGVRYEFYHSTGGSMFKNGDVVAITFDKRAFVLEDWLPGNWRGEGKRAKGEPSR